MSTMPAASVSGAVAACSQPRSCGLTSSRASRHLLAECARSTPPWRPRRVGAVGSSLPTVAARARRGSRPRPSKVAHRGGLEARAQAGALPRLRGAGRPPAPGGPAAQARRRDARRQPPVGARPSARTPRTATAPAPPTSRRCSSWCDELGVEVVTLWLLSTDNLNRPPDELDAAARDHRGRGRPTLAAAQRWRLNPVGALDLLPAETAARAQGGRRRHPRRRRPDGQHRGRLRRAARDRRRRTVAAAGARRARAPRSRSWPRSSTSSTSPSTSTPRASPTRTW